MNVAETSARHTVTVVAGVFLVLETIYRHRYEEGKSMLTACVESTREAGIAALMTTLTSVAAI